MDFIIGMITDTGAEPLVLCSNCCTLWYSDVINNFDIIDINSPQWKTLEHAIIDISKIKYQYGDIIKRTYSPVNSYGYLLAATDYTRTRISAIPLKYYSESYDYLNVNKSFIESTIFDCIIEPRMTHKELTTGTTVPGIPNFHGCFTKSSLSSLRFPE